MTVVTVVTAAGAEAVPFLRAAGESVRDAVLPGGMTIEWLVVVDARPGPARTALVQAAAPADRVLVNATVLGPGATRNRALQHATGSWVATLDADDLLMPQAPAAWAATWRRFPGRWQVHRAADFGSDGLLEPPPSPWDEGAVARGAWADHLRRTDCHPLHPVAVLYPRDALEAAGGWGAGCHGEDAQPVVVVTTQADGAHSHAVTHAYRRHPGQTSSQPAHAAEAAASRRGALWSVSASGRAHVARPLSPPGRGAGPR